MAERERERESSSELAEGNSLPDGGNGNLLLEGDNYVWLKVLEQSHKGKIDVIYIDPPYNTGHEDFIYNDKYTEDTEEFFHSKWLDFMFRRLTLANALLADDGLIFISIGEQEIAPLKMLCDSIFASFITIFHWKQTSTPPSLGRIRNNIEYVLCYQKTHTKMKLFGRASSESDAPLANRTNRVTTLRIPKGQCCFPNLQEGTVIAGVKESGTELLDDVTIGNHTNINEFSVRFQSKWHQENLDAELASGTTLIVKSIKNFSIRYQKQEVGYVVPDKFLDSGKFDVQTNEYGRKQLLQTLGYAPFPYPKNTPLIKTLIRMYHNERRKTITVLDFFAGSGTTAQAVAELNAEDGGNRRWILVTNNEGETENDPSKGIMRSVTKPRIDTVLTGIRADGTKYSDGTGDGYDFMTYDLSTFERPSSYRDALARCGQPAVLDGYVRLRYGVGKIELIVDGRQARGTYMSRSGDVAVTVVYGNATAEYVAAAAADMPASARRILVVSNDLADIAADVAGDVEITTYGSILPKRFLG